MIVSDSRRGFSVIELLVVCGITGVLVGLALPAILHTRRSAARIACQNNLRQVALALHAHHDFFGQFPPLPAKTAVTDPNRLLGWMALVLPQLEYESLYLQAREACRIQQNVLLDPPHIALSTIITPLVCPDDSRLASPLLNQFGIRASYTSYIGIGGAVIASRGYMGVLGGAGSKLSEVVDGSSMTIMASERPPPASLDAGWWYPGWWHYKGHGPNNTIVLGTTSPSINGIECHVTRALGPGRLSNPCDRLHLWSLHGGGANLLFADGSVRFVAYSADPIIPSLATRDGGESVALRD